MFERIPNKYVLHENYAVGATGTGAEYIIDIDDYYKIKNFTCYSHKNRIYFHKGK